MIDANNIATRADEINYFVLVKGGAAEFIGFVELVFNAMENKQMRVIDEDKTILHSEIAFLGSKMYVADSKAEWLFTPAFPQVYVEDAQAVLDRALLQGAELITPVAHSLPGLKMARFKDRWSNIWWLFERMNQEGHGTGMEPVQPDAAASAEAYATFMEAMRNLK